MQETPQKIVRIWDPLVRIGHWVLVAGFAAAYLTEDDLLGPHVWAGYAVGTVIVLRLAWGLIGPRHARFSDFIYAPRTIMAYIKDLLHFRGRRYLGHSPAGGAMILALLLILSATVYTGLMTYALDKNRGPLASFAAQAPETIISTALADDDDNDGTTNRNARRHFWKEIHEIFSNAALLLIVLHVGGVTFVSYIHRENLVRAMITGDKRSELEE